MERSCPHPRVIRFERSSEDGIWHATADTAEGPVTAVGISMGKARQALEQQLREVEHRSAAVAGGPSGDDS
jgi:hypothetical protein